LNPGDAILSVSADAVVHVIRLSLLCFGLSDKQLMPRVSTSVAIASLGIWRTGNWVRGTFGFIGWKVLENLVLEIQIFLLKKKLKILAIESIVILSPFALGILAAVASIIWWILIVVVAIFKLLATSIFGLAKIVTQFHDFIGTRLLSWSLDRFHRHYRHLDQFVHTEDRSPLTFSSCMEAGCFVLIARGNEWDEVLLVSQHEGSEWLCYTTTPDGSRFMWSLLKMTLGNFRGVEGRDQNRGPPGGIRAADVNWLCHPENLGVKWAPTAPQLVSLVAEGRTIMDIIKQEPVSPPRHVAGSPTELVELVPQGQAGALAPAQPPQQAMSSSGLGPATGADPLELRKLADVVNSIRSDLNRDDKKKKKKKKKRDRSSSSGKKKKSKKRGRSSSSSSTSSSGSSNSSYIRWKHEGKSKKVDAVKMGKVDTKRFKKRSDLLIFASKHPGALTANFINGVRQKLMKGGITRTSQLKDVELTEYVTTGSAGLKEVRDKREAMTILQAMDHINRSEISQAMDILSMRIVALLEAKTSGGTWEKASKKELIPDEASTLAPAGLAGMS
jgi:hypothetical protein